LNAYKGRRRKNRNYLEGTICNFNHRRIEVLNVHSCRNEDENEEDEEDEEDEDDQEEEEEGKNLKKKQNRQQQSNQKQHQQQIGRKRNVETKLEFPP